MKRYSLIFLEHIFDFIFFLIYAPVRWYCQKKIIDLKVVKKILIFEPWGLGDLVLATPIFKKLKMAAPQAKIILVAKKHALELFWPNFPVDEIIVFDFPWTAHCGKYDFSRWDFKAFYRLFKRLKSEQIDLAIDARMDIRNNFLMVLSGARRRVGFGVAGCRSFLTDIISLKNTPIHRVEAWRFLAQNLGIETDFFEPFIVLEKAEQDAADLFLKEKGVNDQDMLIGIHPGAGIKLRCWPQERFKDLADYMVRQYRAKIIVFVEPDGYGTLMCDKNEFIIAQVSLRKMAALMKKCRLFICNDAGPMHLAVAVHTLVLAIFGPGDTRIISPFGAKHRLVRKEGISCRPCHDFCRFEKPRCLLSLRIEEVIPIVDDILSAKVYS